MYDLTKREELVLLSIMKLQENAYGVTIKRNIRELTDKSINYGSLCNTLYLLSRKGLIESTESEPLAQRGGRRKVLYTVTNEGRFALKQVYEIQKMAWHGITEILLGND